MVAEDGGEEAGEIVLLFFFNLVCWDDGVMNGGERGASGDRWGGISTNELMDRSVNKLIVSIWGKKKQKKKQSPTC